METWLQVFLIESACNKITDVRNWINQTSFHASVSFLWKNKRFRKENIHRNQKLDKRNL